MSTGYQINDQGGLYYLTFQIVDWINILSRQVYRDIVVDNLKYTIEYKGLELYAFVIMFNHVHLIAQSINGTLSNTIRDIKKHISRKIIETVQTIPESRKEWMLNRFAFNAKQNQRSKNFQVWTQENHAVYLYNLCLIREKLDYLYSSARFYAGLECVLPVVDIGLPWRTI
jgi:REP element-mobilizing transposase RayT